MKLNTRWALPLLASLGVVHTAHALETTDIEFRDGVTADGSTRIYRENDHLVFDDGMTSPAIRLSDLVSNSSDHSGLGNLGADDHPHYLNANRHDLVHDAIYNGDLSIPADVAGNETLGEHLDDGTIHPDISDDETVTGDWFFSGDTGLIADPLILRHSEDNDDAAIEFVTENGEGLLLFDDVLERFSATPSFHSPLMEAEIVTVADDLVGSINGSPSASIWGFSSIEGIDSTDLLSRSANESIIGEWNFEGELGVNYYSSSDQFSENALTVFFDSDMSAPDPVSDRSRSTVLATANHNILSDEILTNIRLQGVYGYTVMSNSSGDIEGMVTGVTGYAESLEPGMHPVGLFGIAANSQTNRIGLLASDHQDAFNDTDLIPDGTWAGYFMGDVGIDGDVTVSEIDANGIVAKTVSADTFVIKAPVYGSGTIAANAVVEWTADGKVRSGQNWNGASTSYAGVNLDFAVPGGMANIAVQGIAEVSCNTTITTGTTVTWNGTSLISTTGTESRILGTALEAHDGIGTVLIPVHIQPQIK